MTLDLAYNRIGNDGAQYLADALKYNEVTVILRCLRVQRFGANKNPRSYILRVFETFYQSLLTFHIQTLIALELGSNQIKESGTLHLARALESNNVTLTFPRQFY